MSQRLPALRLVAAALALGLGACSHIPLSTMVKLRAFDVMEVDMGALRAAVRVPQAIAVRPGGARIIFSSWRAGEDDKKRSETFQLEEVPGEKTDLSAERAAGMTLTVFRIAPADLPRVEAMRADLARQKTDLEKTGRRAHGSISVAADGCARGPVPEGPLLISTYVKTEAGGAFLPLVQDIDLRSLGADGAGNGALDLKPCD